MALLHKVFVYGTLKSGQPNHYLLEGKRCVGNAEFLGKGRTVERFPLVISENYSYPFLLDKEGVGIHIAGEVYSVDAAVFAQLDELEGYPDLYQRREISVRIQNAAPEAPSILRCIVYLNQNFPPKHLQFPHIEDYDIAKVMDYLPPDDPRTQMTREQLVDLPMTE